MKVGNKISEGSLDSTSLTQLEANKQKRAANNTGNQSSSVGDSGDKVSVSKISEAINEELSPEKLSKDAEARQALVSKFKSLYDQGLLKPSKSELVAEKVLEELGLEVGTVGGLFKTLNE